MSRPIELSDVRRAVRGKVVELARRRGVNAEHMQDLEVIPEAGVLDSVGIMELIIWIETTYDLTIDQSDLTMENFGTVEAMARYIQCH